MKPNPAYLKLRNQHITMQHLLDTFLPVQTTSHHTGRMQQAITTLARRLGYKVRRDKAQGNLYVTKGEADTYPCIVAHMDTVHDILPKGHKLVPVYSRDGKWLTGFDDTALRQSGIGGDDKCGIIAAFAVAERLPAIKLAFFVDEEVGCVGSEDADLKFFADCRFILQADRRGKADFVTDIWGPLSSDTFQEDVAPILAEFGYAPCSGAMTDVQALRDGGVGISCANMSAGYHRPHSPDETICLPHLENCINLMHAICTRLTAAYPHEYEPQWYRGWSRATDPTTTNYTTTGGEWEKWKNEARDERDWKMSRNLPVGDRFPEVPYEDLDLVAALSDLGYTDAEIEEVYETAGRHSLETELRICGCDPDSL